jgi:MFS superfamily sulfate permease-like transporter
MFKVQNSIHFVNCENFQKQLYKQFGCSPVESLLTESSEENFNWKNVINQNFNKTNSTPAKQNLEENLSEKKSDIILDVSAVNYLDTNGAKTLQQTVEDFKKINVFVYICGSQGKNCVKLLYI